MITFLLVDVLILIKNRLKGEKDPYHLALSVEGGMMRGTISAGMIEELHAAGLGRIFDSFWGTSIGAANAAYLAAGETKGKSRLYEKAVGHLFKRPSPTTGFIDLDWLFRVGFKEIEPLDFEKLTRQKKLRILVTKAGWWEAREAVSLFNPATGSDYQELLLAACRAPIAAGLPVRNLRGGLWDGNSFENWPMKTPLQSGATHLLILRATPHMEPRSIKKRGYIAATNWFFNTPSYLSQERELERLIKKGIAASISPTRQIIRLAEKDPIKISAANREGRDAFKRFFDSL